MNDTQLNEHELVLRLTNGDKDAFCELYAQYKNRLIYFAMKFVKSRDFAEDIFQDTFTSIWQTHRFINPDADFSSYLYTIVRNRVLNEIRGIQTNQKLKESILSQAIDFTNNTKEHVAFNDLQRILDDAVKKLTPRQREIFEMSRVKQMSHKEIAGLLGISINTVQEHISVSLRIIQSYLRKYGSYSDLLLILICFNI
jgi:RNA polymerase sigma-70 factor (ECF subfamily)